jgi:hypothetical protein
MKEALCSLVVLIVGVLLHIITAELTEDGIASVALVPDDINPIASDIDFLDPQGPLAGPWGT